MLLLALAIVGIAACGSSETPITADEASREILLDLPVLPAGTKRAEKPLAGQRCSPASHFRRYAEAVLSVPGFLLPKDKLLQQVGVFATHEEAVKAFHQVLSGKARRCVEREMQATSLQLAGSKGTITFKRLPDTGLGDVTAQTIRLHFTHPYVVLNVEQTMMVDGRAFTTLTFVSENHHLSPNVWQAVADTAAASLTEASADLET
jgi:hypothetical protein